MRKNDKQSRADPINLLEFKENGYSTRDTLKQVMLLMQGRFYRRERGALCKFSYMYIHFI